MGDKMSEKLDDEKKKQLLFRVKECVDNDVLVLSDWLKIYGILLEACNREHTEAFEQLLTNSIEAGEPGD